jgi:hypothetical protein
MMVIVLCMQIMELYKSDMGHAPCMLAMVSCLLAMTLRMSLDRMNTLTPYTLSKAPRNLLCLASNRREEEKEIALSYAFFL